MSELCIAEFVLTVIILGIEFEITSFSTQIAKWRLCVLSDLYFLRVLRVKEEGLEKKEKEKHPGGR